MLLTCEHGGNAVPPRFAYLFRSTRARAALASHRGYDIGAADIARRMAQSADIPVLIATTSRLLVDLNRSEGHPRLFSEFSAPLPAALRRELVATLHTPHRAAVEMAIRTTIEQAGHCTHVAVHSFTPVLHGRLRNADVGLLYDPSRTGEAALCRRWQRLLSSAVDELRVRRNYPYRGNTDGLTTAMRRVFRDADYAGIELEMNQSTLGSAGDRQALATFAARTMIEAIAETAAAADTAR